MDYRDEEWVRALILKKDELIFQLEAVTRERDELQSTLARLSESQRIEHYSLCDEIRKLKELLNDALHHSPEQD